jgi:hypothetical protein
VRRAALIGYAGALWKSEDFRLQQANAGASVPAPSNPFTPKN